MRYLLFELTVVHTAVRPYKSNFDIFLLMIHNLPNSCCFQLQKNRRKSGEYFLHNGGGNTFQAFPVSGFQIQGARLVTTHNAGCASAGVFKWYGKPGCAGKIAARGNRHDNRHLGHFVERIGGNHQNRAG